eukprot:857711-Alexandrium_andersonii.AAC.1
MHDPWRMRCGEVAQHERREVQGKGVCAPRLKGGYPERDVRQAGAAVRHGQALHLISQGAQLVVPHQLEELRRRGRRRGVA